MSWSRPRLPAELMLVCGALGCSEGPVFVPWTPHPEARSQIRVVIGAGHAILGAWAEPSEAPALRAEVEAAASSLYILEYREELEALGLAAGELGPGARCRRRCALADPIRIEAYDLEDAPIAPRTAEPTIRSALVEHLLPEHASWCGSQCLRFETELVDLDLDTRIIGAVTRPDGSVWVFGEDRRSRVLAPEGLVQPGCTVTSTGVLVAATSDGRWRSWVSTASGEIIGIASEDALASGACPEMIRSPALPFEAMTFLAASSAAEAPDEVFGIGYAGHLWHFTPAGGWVSRGAFQPPALGAEERYRAGELLWLGPGRALAVRDTRELLVIDGDETRSELVSVAGSDRLIAARMTEAGLLQLSAQGAGLIESPSPGGPWTVEIELPFEVLSAFRPLRDHLLLVQKRSVEARHPELGTCAVTGLENAGMVKLLLPFPGGSDFVIADYSGNPSGGEYPTRHALIVRTKLPCEL